VRITIDIPDELIEEAMRLGGFSTVQECVIAALELLISMHEPAEKPGGGESDADDNGSAAGADG